MFGDDDPEEIPPVAAAVPYLGEFPPFGEFEDKDELFDLSELKF